MQKTIIPLFSALLLLSSISCLNYALDNYTVTQDWLIIHTTLQTTYPNSTFSSVQGVDILGGERDLVLTVTESVYVGKQITTRVAENEGWEYYNSESTIHSYCLCQYDGEDNSPDFNPIGLGGLDFNTLSDDKSFGITTMSDAAVSANILVTDMEGGSSSSLLTLQYSEDEWVTWRIPFSRFTGNANFSNVGGVEIQVQSDVTSDVHFNDFVLNGILPSPIPSSPSQSNSISPYKASYSRTRTPTRVNYFTSFSPVDVSTITSRTSLFTSFTSFYFTSWSTFTSWSSRSSSSDNISGGTVFEIILLFGAALVIILAIVALVFFTVIYPRIKNQNQPQLPVTSNPTSPVYLNPDRDAFYL